MPPTPPNGLQHDIVELLRTGPLPGRELLAKLNKRVGKTTKQGMYAALRKLITAEIVVKHKRQISLNVAWLTKLESFLSHAEQTYTKTPRPGTVLDMRDGDRIRYEFGNTNLTEAFWNHTNHVLAANHPKTPWFGYNPHCWFFLADPERERGFRDFIAKNGGQYFIMADGTWPLDRAIRSEFDGKNSQYFIRHSPLFKKQDYYLNVIGDYLIEAWLDPAHARVIERIYASATEITADVQKRLRDVINSKGRTRLIVSRDKKKAERLRRTLAKPFYVRKLK